MAEPPRDSDGIVLPHDDPDLHGEIWLLRRVPADKVVREGGVVRASSAAFQESSTQYARYGGMSVDIEPLMAAAPEVPPGGGVVRLKVSTVRKNGHQTGPDPLPGHSSHANVWHKPVPRPGKKLYIGDDWEWVIRPPD
jgi:hypothetical protein